MNGACSAAGPMIPRRPCSMRRPARSNFASSPATCTSCSVRQAISRCAFGCGWTALPRAPITASTRTPKATASSASSDCISSFVRRAPARRIRSPSSSWTPARRPIHSHSVEDMMNGNRRAFLIGGVATLTGAWLARRSRPADASTAAPGSAQGVAKTVTIEDFSPDGKSLGVKQVAKVVKSEADWRAQLSPLAFQVARQAGTEYPFSGEYDKNHAVGVYRCVCCDTALYDSRTKFDSGTAWPSFYRVISRYNVVQGKDWTLAMLREAVSCARCDAHLGHVFDDGPKPTGLRYCMNSVSLRFVPAST